MPRRTHKQLADIAGSWLSAHCAACGAEWLFRSNMFSETGGLVPLEWCRHCGQMDVRWAWIDVVGKVTQARDSGPKEL